MPDNKIILGNPSPIHLSELPHIITCTVSVNQKLHYEKCSISKLRGPLPPRFVSESGQVRTFLWYDYFLEIYIFTFHFSVWRVEASGFESPKLHVQKDIPGVSYDVG